MLRIFVLFIPTDFGFACAGANCEMLIEACGSYGYAAPEIMEGEYYLGKVADLWSMGNYQLNL